MLKLIQVKSQIEMELCFSILVRCQIIFVSLGGEREKYIRYRYSAMDQIQKVMMEFACTQVLCKRIN